MGGSSILPSRTKSQYSLNMKKQVIVIHGGNSYPTYKGYIASLKKGKLDKDDLTKPKEQRWKETLGAQLGASYEVLRPEMPNSDDAKYLEWKIYFEKIIPFVRPGVILVGHSLGGIFLAKYLSETTFSKKIRGTFLIAPPYEDGTSKGEYSIPQFKLPKSLVKLQKQGGEVFIYQSKDDKVVPFGDSKKYFEKLPTAHLTIFTDRGHFRQLTLPELVKDIKDLCK